MYEFETKWIKGKYHEVPDELSRSPVSHPEDDEKLLRDVEYHRGQVIRVPVIRETHLEDEERFVDPLIEDIRKKAIKDQTYKDLVNTVEDNCINDPVQPFSKILNDLSTENGIVLYGNRLVIPKERQVEALHSSHQGIEKTKRRAREAIYWPRMNSDNEEMIRICRKCIKRLPSLPEETMMRDPILMRPFESTSADLFEYGGDHYLLYGDRLS
ncbi:uncharacterized protein [Lepeophtheirus salmonis]|uniref:uncharacterized protein n=1 Tax=Lepeophtheirus salmonis TaxID=72036 RepID=UPI001AE2E69B|nr:uncharacterized protein LOC121132218 [Lepeophtheirus salmonis]